MACSELEWQQCQSLADHCGVQATRLEAGMVDPELLQQMPLELLSHHKMVPLKRDGFEVTLAMADPMDLAAEDAVRFITGCRVQRVAAPAGEILEALDGKLPQAPSEDGYSSLLDQLPELQISLALSGEPESEPEAEDLAPEGPIIQLVNSILGDAIRLGVSDIHIEPQKKSLRIRYRLDGQLRTMAELPKRVQSACLSRIKISAGMDISESRKPQDGRMRAVWHGREVDLRVSSLPTFYGEKIVMRLLDPDAVVVSLDNLGLCPAHRAYLNESLAASQGLILCTGPTGSGKTSTLYSSLLHLHEDTENLVTVEDPVEYQLAGINQVQVHPKAGLTFAGSLRSILRQDPDVVLIGEIRDLETAEIAVQAAQTGHLVLSSLHTNDAISTVGRLLMMGLAPFLLASALQCVMAQRLVRRLCPKCKQPGQPDAEAMHMLTLAGIQRPPQTCYEPVGCPHCNGVGYKGRLGIFEFFMVTDPIRTLLLAQASESELEEAARREGMTSLLEDGLAKVEQGHTSLAEVLRVVTIRRVGGRPCPGCQACVPVQHQHCVHCGTRVSRRCGGCRTPLEKDWKVCPECGQRHG